VANSLVCPLFFFFFLIFLFLPSIVHLFKILILLACVDGEKGGEHENWSFHYGNEKDAYLLELFGIICFMFFNSINMLGVGG
jgi:hypothetical protein